MDKRELKKQILGQLASYLRNSVIIDGLYGDEMHRCHEQQLVLADEFERRCKSASDHTDK
ncbi:MULTISPECIES: hypothetical protein [Pseudomonas syringae group]|nr:MULTISPECIES: hypothetical protein [Pseudomonas syringae group]MDH4602429.1 hypothetical protein [Pseudomonas syringae pv. papulans]